MNLWHLWLADVKLFLWCFSYAPNITNTRVMMLLFHLRVDMSHLSHAWTLRHQTGRHVDIFLQNVKESINFVKFTEENLIVYLN